MSVFVPLQVSVFDPAFTLEPYPFLEPLYAQSDVLGFSSEGMNFCFRFEDCHDLIAAHKNVAREPVQTEDTDSEARAFAEQYPTRAWHFQYSLGDMKVKVILNRYLAELLDRMQLDEAETVFKRFRRPGRHEDYMDDVRYLPMRILLTAWGFEYTDEQIERLYESSLILVKSFDNYSDTDLMDLGEQGMIYNRAYVREQVENARPGTLLHDFVAEVQDAGYDVEYAIASLVTFVQSTPNTISISTALMLRNILRYPDAVRPLRENPARIDDSVVMEFLRRDNHVKALARQVHDPFELRGRQLQRGDSLYIFYPGINLDPTHWEKPLTLDFSREFTHANHNIFGGSRYACIGRQIALKYFADILPHVLENLPESAHIDDKDIEIDGDWVAERVITRMPIFIGGQFT